MDAKSLLEIVGALVRTAVKDERGQQNSSKDGGRSTGGQQNQKPKQAHQSRPGHNTGEKASSSGNQGKKDHKKDLETAFFQLNYPYVDLQNNGTVAVSKKPAGKPGDKIRPIVYVNKPLKEGKRLVFSVVNSISGEWKQKFVFIFGLTTCHQTKWRDHYFHVNEFCKDGTFECGGYSASIPVFVDDTNVKSVEIEKLDKGALCRLTTVFKNGTSKSRAFKDLTEGRKIEAVGKYYPFIILEGFATKIRVSERPLKVNVEVARPATAPSVRVPFSMEKNSWVLGNGMGLALDSKLIRRASGTSFYAISKSTISPRLTLKFSIDTIDQTRSGTLTLGLTTIDLDGVSVDGLPDPNSLHKSTWTTCSNILPSSAVGQEFMIKFDESGMQFRLNQAPFQLLIRKDQIKANAHFYFHLGGKVTGIKFVPRPPKPEPQAAAAAPAPTESSKNGVCLSCYDYEATHTMVPCGHCCLCKDCSNVYTRPDCPFCRAIIRERIRTYFPGRESE